MTKIDFLRYLRSVSAILLPLIILWFFFGNILSDPGNYFFASGGDGLKSYYGTYYHLKYDKHLIHSASQNYPNGESVFYGDSQPLISNFLILLKKLGFDFSEDLIAILNLVMLLSIAAGAYVLYFLLRRLGLPYFYSLIAAVIIAFLSPQLDRMGGHFSLSYVLMIPLFLLFFHRFFLKPNLKDSVLIGLIVLTGLALHAYYFAFFGLVIILYLLSLVFNKQRTIKIFPDIFIHLVIQIVLPYLIIELLNYGYHSDRTSYPWGFFNSKAFFESVFLPNGKPYASFINIHYLNWEGIAFIGMVAVVGFFVGIDNYFRHYFKNTPSKFHSDPFISTLLWISLLALFFSFTFPFSWGLEWLWNYMGPLKQFRASGRFAWLFYYTINIAVFYSLWKWYEESRKIHYLIILIFGLGWGCYDAFLNVRGRENMLKNEIPELTGKIGGNSNLKWMEKVKASDFQAIISLPYYHIGSEAYWLDGSANSAKNAFIASWKTGLPVCNVMLSRTSIKQTVRNLGLRWEPLQDFEILEDFKGKKDFLLFVQKDEVVDENELRLILYSDIIFENENIKVCRLPISAFKTLRNDYLKKINDELVDRPERRGFKVSNENEDFILITFGDDFSTPGIKTISADPKRAEVIIDTVLTKDTTILKISFWMGDLDKDLIPRTRVILNNLNSEGNFEEVYNNDIFKLVKFVNKEGWGLVELDYKPKGPDEKLRIYMTNNLLTGRKIEVDNILIRPADLDIWSDRSGFIFKNNRIIK